MRKLLNIFSLHPDLRHIKNWWYIIKWNEMLKSQRTIFRINIKCRVKFLIPFFGPLNNGWGRSGGRNSDCFPSIEGKKIAQDFIAIVLSNHGRLLGINNLWKPLSNLTNWQPQSETSKLCNKYCFVTGMKLRIACSSAVVSSWGNSFENNGVWDRWQTSFRRPFPVSKKIKQRKSSNLSKNQI